MSRSASPTVAGASVAAEVLEQGRGPKVIAFKKRRRKNSRRKRGHRQEFTLVRVTEILTDGATPTKSRAAEAERNGTAEAATPGPEADARAKPEAEARLARSRNAEKRRQARRSDDFVTKLDYIAGD